MGKNQSEKAWQKQKFGESTVPHGSGAGLRHTKNHKVCAGCGNTNPADTDACLWPGCPLS